MDNQSPVSQSGATEIFRMPSADATVPDLMAASKPVQPTLTIVKGPQIGETFELNVFLNDMTVSRHHATLNLETVASGYATIKDQGSLNGTWVDGAIVNEATLKDGSTIQIGTFRMVFHTNARSKRIATEI